MKWIESGGGPFIIIDKKNAASWGGASEKDGRHYELACNPTGYIESMTIDDMAVVILNDEPLSTTVLDQNLGGQVIIRWRNAQKEADILDAVRSMGNPAPQEQVNVSWESKELVLFDAAEVFDEQTDFLEIKLSKKECTFETLEYQNPAVKLSVLLHRIR